MEYIKVSDRKALERNITSVKKQLDELFSKNNSEFLQAIDHKDFQKAFDIAEKSYLTTELACLFIVSDVEFLPYMNHLNSSMFSRLDGIEELIIPNNITSIGASCFRLSSIKQIEVEGDVIDIGLWAFGECPDLIRVVLHGAGLIHSQAFFKDYALTQIYIKKFLKLPNNEKNLEDTAFYDCKSLHEITFGGTSDEWKEATRNVEWNRFCFISKVFCKDKDIMLKPYF